MFDTLIVGGMRTSAVGVLAGADAGDLDRIAEITEEDAVVLSAQAVERRVHVLQALYVAFF